MPLNQSDRSLGSKPTPPVCRIWGDRYDAGLLPRHHSPPAPPSPHGPPSPPPPPGPGPKLGDVVALPCNISNTAQQWKLAGTWRDGVAQIKWHGGPTGEQRCLAYSTTRAAAYAHGQAIIEAQCGSGKEQLWNFTGGSLRSSEPVKCINYQGPCQCVNGDKSGTYELFHCLGARGRDTFAFKSTDPSDPSVGQIAASSGASACLTVMGASVAPDYARAPSSALAAVSVLSQGYQDQGAVASIAGAGGDPEDPQVSVEVVTAAPNVLLLLDGVVVGAQSRDPNPISRQFGPLSDAEFKVPFRNGSNLTALCRDAQNRTVARHSIVAPSAPAALRLSLDAPSAEKGTGTHLLLDGQDTALLRAEIIDDRGNFVGSNLSINVTFSVTTGPGRVSVCAQTRRPAGN